MSQSPEQSSTESRRFRIGKGKKVHAELYSGSALPLRMRDTLCGLWWITESVGHRTSDPVDCKTCLRALNAREQS